MGNLPPSGVPGFWEFINYPFVLLLTAVIFSLWYTFAIIYHLIRFGIGTAPKKTALIFLAGSMLFLVIAVIAYTQVDLSAVNMVGQ